MRRRHIGGSRHWAGVRARAFGAWPACVLVSGLSAYLLGCATAPTRGELSASTLPHLEADAPPGIVDGRAGFERLFCAALASADARKAEGSDCGTWLHHRSTDGATVPVTATDLAVPLDVVLVTGAFSECFGPSARPFDDAVAAVASDRVDIETLVVGGRSGSAHNARQIAEFLEARPADPSRPLVLIGYSKGTTDILQFLGDFPATAEHVDAVVSVAGAVGGSPLADRFDGIYGLIFSHLPSGHCPHGDGEVVHSLRTDVRQDWLRTTPLPSHIDYYSIAAFTTRERMARGLVPAWELLLRHDRRNDGQLLPHDALIPSSTLLGYLDADHWAVAMHLEDERPMLTRRRDARRFPHTALLRAILLQVAQDRLSRPRRHQPVAASSIESMRPR